MPTEAGDWAIDVLLDDGPLLAVNKPAGVLTQGVPAGIATLESAVKAYLKARFQKPGNVYLGIPHRLDRPVSGVIVFARNSKAAARLAEEFRERRVRKTYWALVAGIPQERFGRLVDWLKKHPDEARTEIVDSETPGAREAVLEYRVLAERSGENGARALLEIDLHTGRMHQIRVQLAARGFPVLGDTQYAGLAKGDSLGVAPSRIALHARRLVLRHPVRYDEVTITAPVPWRKEPVCSPNEVIAALTSEDDWGRTA